MFVCFVNLARAEEIYNAITARTFVCARSAMWHVSASVSASLFVCLCMCVFLLILCHVLHVCVCELSNLTQEVPRRLL